ncbi:lytic transglycosylase [Microvirga sp. KLBC 81]|uniref:lytic transglycosylase domain-containing protein n=1 Tax=Microvirga sp. KLBC 81 TaxID=1862707 RepID=UPI000D51C635|nr:lytic transglycosylase domain-containing protein [Microvirga sp. KLBC 81]PVE22739.1 lytic transglycosylase [Microvirga sp. KLBC 81]
MPRTVLRLLSGLSLACVLSCSTFAESSTIAKPSPRDPYGGHIAEAAQRFELPTAWIRAVLKAESNGDPRAISPKGAMGLMQIMPETWAELRVRHRLNSDPYDPHDNIIAGAAYIRMLLDRYGSPGWIAAYNAGPGRYEASLKGRPLPAETRAYVTAVASVIEGSDTASRVVIVAADPLAWTRAPLFVMQRKSDSAADPVQAERSASDAPAATAIRDVSAIVPQSGGLFVASATAGTLR